MTGKPTASGCLKRPEAVTSPPVLPSSCPAFLLSSVREGKRPRHTRTCAAEFNFTTIFPPDGMQP
jgi:hypothetical protein